MKIEKLKCITVLANELAKPVIYEIGEEGVVGLNFNVDESWVDVVTDEVRIRVYAKILQVAYKFE